MKPRWSRRIRRVLVAVATLAGWVGLWAPPAEAAIQCRSYDVRSCDAYTCWSQHCAYCFDTVTGEIYSEVWGEPDCWDKFP